MKSLQSLIVLAALAGAAALNASDAPPENDSVLQSTGFGPEDGYTPGDVNGQRGWATLGEPAVIAGSSLVPGTQALQLAPGSDSWAVHWFSPASFQTVQINLMMELLAGTDACDGSRLSIGNAGIGFVRNESGASVQIKRLLDDGGEELFVPPQVIPVDSEGNIGWSQVGVRIDYDSGLWSLKINGISIADHLPWTDSGTGTTPIMVSAGESGPAQIASVEMAEAGSLAGDEAAETAPGQAAANPGGGALSAMPVSQASASTSTNNEGGSIQNSSAAAGGFGEPPAFFAIFSPN